jgi:hypothetical protein
MVSQKDTSSEPNLQTRLDRLRARAVAPYAEAISDRGDLLATSGDPAGLSQPGLPSAYMYDDERRRARFECHRESVHQPQLVGMGNSIGVDCYVRDDLLVILYIDASGSLHEQRERSRLLLAMAREIFSWAPG